MELLLLVRVVRAAGLSERSGKCWPPARWTYQARRAWSCDSRLIGTGVCVHMLHIRPNLFL